MATNPITLLDGTTAFASDVETKVNPLYTSLDYTNFSASAISGTGTKLLTDVGATGSFTSFTQSASATGTSVTSTTANAASIIIQNTNTTINNFQGVDFKNDTGAIVGRIACVNNDHTAASEDISYQFVGMLGGTLKTFFSVNTTTIAGANNIVISDGSQSIDQGLTIYTATNKTGYLGFTDTGAALQGWVAYNHTTNLLSFGSGTNEIVLIGTGTGISSTINDATTTLTSGWASRVALTNSNATADAGSAIECYNSSSVMMGKIACVNVDNTAASEDSKFSILTRRAGTLSQVMTIEGDVFRFQPGGTERIGVDGSVATTSLLTFPNCQQTTGNVISVSAADSLTTGSILNLVSNSSSSSSRNLVYIKNDHSSATGTTCLNIEQDSSATALTVTANNSGSTNHFVYINNLNQSASDTICMKFDALNLSGGGAIGIDLVSSGITKKFKFGSDTTAAGSYYGRVPVEVSGVGLKYMHLFN